MKGVRWVGILSAIAPMHTVFAQVNHWIFHFKSVVVNVHLAGGAKYLYSEMPRGREKGGEGEWGGREKIGEKTEKSSHAQMT